MPTSDPAHIASIVYQIQAIQPARVLDLGVGFGKYGVLVREFIDVQAGRLDETAWMSDDGVVLHGVEGCVKYINIIHEAIYNEVWYENILDGVDKYKDYDLVLLVDVLEHFEKEQGEALLKSLIESNRYVIVASPAGEYPQGDVYDNELERHRHMWSGNDLVRFQANAERRLIHRGVCNVVVYKRVEEGDKNSNGQVA